MLLCICVCVCVCVCVCAVSVFSPPRGIFGTSTSLLRRISLSCLSFLYVYLYFCILYFRSPCFFDFNVCVFFVFYHVVAICPFFVRCCLAKGLLQWWWPSYMLGAFRHSFCLKRRLLVADMWQQCVAGRVLDPRPDSRPTQ